MERPVREQVGEYSALLLWTHLSISSGLTKHCKGKRRWDSQHRLGEVRQDR